MRDVQAACGRRLRGDAGGQREGQDLPHLLPTLVLSFQIPWGVEIDLLCTLARSDRIDMCFSTSLLIWSVFGLKGSALSCNMVLAPSFRIWVLF